MARQTISKPLAVSSAMSLALRVGGVVLAYGAHVLLSRSLGLQAYGDYVILLGWALVLTLPARLGLDNSALRYATIYLESGRHGALRAFVQFGGFTILVVASAVAVSMILVGLVKGERAGAVAWAAMLILPLALLGFYSALLRTGRRIFASQFYDQLLRPLVLIIFIGMAVATGTTLNSATALMLTALAALVALAAIIAEHRRSFSFLRNFKPDFQEWRGWCRVSLPLLAIGVAQELLNQMEILLIGYLADARQAGLFSAAWRLASLMPFALQALAMVGAPMIAAAYHRGDRQEMYLVARLGARWGFAFAVIIAILLLLSGYSLLGIFGPEFPKAYPALVIILAGGLANAFTGFVAYFLTLTGREWTALWIFITALALSLVMNLLLIPRLGIAGAAIASASALSFWNIAMLIYVRRVIGIDASALGMKPQFA